MAKREDYCKSTVSELLHNTLTLLVNPNRPTTLAVGGLLIELNFVQLIYKSRSDPIPQPEMTN